MSSLPPTTDPPMTDPAMFTVKMRSLRRRRWFLWGLVLIYLPAIYLALQLSGSDRVAGIVFVVWILLVCVAVGLAAFAICPRCAKTFHMHGFVPVYLRRCVHCGLHVSSNQPDDA